MSPLPCFYRGDQLLIISSCLLSTDVLQTRKCSYIWQRESWIGVDSVVAGGTVTLMAGSKAVEGLIVVLSAELVEGPARVAGVSMVCVEGVTATSPETIFSSCGRTPEKVFLFFDVPPCKVPNFILAI